MTSSEDRNLGTVFLVDDDEEFLASLVYLLNKAGFHSVHFESAHDFLDAPHELGPACLILDQSMPRMSGIDLFQELKLRKFTTPVVFLTGDGTVRSAVQALQLGAVEYLEKPLDPSQLIECVKRCIESDRQAMLNWSEAQEMKNKFDLLTARELEVVALIRDGIPSKQIASRLGLSIKTIEVHRSHISKKLGAKSAAQLLHMICKPKDS